MPDTHQNRRRSRLLRIFLRACHSVRLGWDFYLFAVGYGLVFGFLGAAALALPDPGAGGVPAGSALEWSAPNMEHWFGVNRDGVDMMSPILRAAGRSIWLALFATVWGSTLGLLIATVFFFIWRDRGYRILNRLSGLTMAIPALFIVLVIAAGHGAGYGSTLFSLGGLCALFVAGRAGRWYQDLESRGDVIAARALGYTKRRLLMENLFGRIWKRVAASSATLLPGVLMAEVALGFSGAGAGVNAAADRLGNLIAAGEEVMFEAPWLVFFPGLILWILATILAAFAWAVRRTLAEPIDDRLF